MTRFIELKISAGEEEQPTIMLVNISSIGRAYANPQRSTKCIVELNYQSVNDAPVFLEVEMTYEEIRKLIMV